MGWPVVDTHTPLGRETKGELQTEDNTVFCITACSQFVVLTLKRPPYEQRPSRSG